MQAQKENANFKYKKHQPSPLQANIKTIDVLKT